MTLRIVVISDTHSLHHQVNIPDGDILVHAGDLTDTGTQAQVGAFNDFWATLPHRHKIVIAGNHDFYFEQSPQEARALLTNCNYLQDEAISIESLKFYGSPWTPWFYDWAFNLQRGAPLREKWEMIPPDTQVLITHGPPSGYGDRTTRGEQTGCADLLDAVARIKPWLHIYGHIHEGAGIRRTKYTTFLNASSCDLMYQPVNPAVVVDIDPQVGILAIS
ncbi:metallophosphatase domain-containing protein [Chloroflexota bacterium]